MWSKGKVIQSAQYSNNSLPFHFPSIWPTIPEIQLFRNLTLKHPRSRSGVRSKVKVTYYTQNPTDVFPFRFTSIGPTIPEIWPKQCLTLKKKHIRNFKRKFAKITVSDRNSPKSNHVITMTTTFCSDWMSGYHFIAQTSKFLLIDATHVTLGKGHRKIIQFISPDIYILCPKYLRFGSNSFDVRDKSRCYNGGNELKTLSHLRLGWLKYLALTFLYLV